MGDSPQTDIHKRFVESSNIWLATVRADSRPHLVPVWFIFSDEQFFICIEPGSVKGKNLTRNPSVSLALEDGTRPVICEGIAGVVEHPWPAEVVDLFQTKYDWDVLADGQYTMLVRIKPLKWLSW